MGFFSQLEVRARQANSLLCVGLDPHPADLPLQSAKAARDFCVSLIEATHTFTAAYKPNAAFFEAFGSEGITALQEVISAVPDGIPVILDAKRGDIASTAEAYARSGFENLGANAMTISPYLGHDSITPFIRNPEKGIFLLCKTSNPGSADLQDLTMPGYSPATTLYEHVALLAQQWNTSDNIGLVVGATHPEALARIRRIAPGLWFLSPGVGAQGGELITALGAGLRSDGFGMLIPVSRGISRADDPHQAAQDLRDKINAAREQLRTGRQPTAPGFQFSELADALLTAGCIKFAEPDQLFILKSGLESPIYLDLRQLVTHPKLLALVADAYIQVLKKLNFNRLGALPYAALPIGTAISLQSGWPMIYPRKESKSYGTKEEIEGDYQPGDRIAVVDDLTTTGTSKFEAIEKLTGADLKVEDVVVLIDRQSGAQEALRKAGYQLHAVLTFTELLDHWEATGKVPPDKISAARQFVQSTGGQ